MFTLVYPDLTLKQSTFDDLIKQSPLTLLYFYPKDNTPGCTVQAKEFTDCLTAFHDLNIQVIGVSKDSPERHCTFISDHKLTPTYLSDPTLILHKQFGARWTKKMYGKEIEGTIRSTILLDQQGKVIHHWKSVKAKGHAQKVLEWCKKQMKDKKPLQNT